jgi:hypothetical protein
MKTEIEGVSYESTSTHGYYYVSERLNKQIPHYMRKSRYEEDIEWCIPFVVLSDYYNDEERKKHAIEVFKNWFFDYYERFFNVVLNEGESTEKDVKIFLERNKENYLPVAGFGDWHKNVPKGMVGVLLRKGGNGRTGVNLSRWEPQGESIGVLVTPKEYNSGRGFVLTQAQVDSLPSFKN